MSRGASLIPWQLYTICGSVSRTVEGLALCHDGKLHAEHLGLDDRALPGTQGAEPRAATQPPPAGPLGSPEPDAPATPNRSDDVELAFPLAVRELSREMWRAGSTVQPETASRHQARALTRAAYVHLRTLHPMPTWPTALQRQYERLFGPRWATSENGRGLRDVLRMLGYAGENAAMERAILRILA